MAEKYEIPEEGASIATEYSSKKRRNANVPGSGVYRHPESGQEMIVQSDPLWGNTQAQGAARLGFKFVREAKAGEIKTLPEIAAEVRSADADTNKGILARLNALEDVAAENKSLSAEVAELKEKLAAEEKAREEAEAQIREAGEKANTGGAAKSLEDAKDSAARAVDSRDQATGNNGAVSQGNTSLANVGHQRTPGDNKDAAGNKDKTNKESGK